MGKKLAIGIGIFLFLIVGLVVAIIFVPLDNYKGMIEEKASAAIGRKVSINGPLSLTLIPMPGVSLEGLEIGNISGAKEKKFATIKQIKAFVSIWPLLKKQVEVSSISIKEPRIFLEKLADGKSNWSFNIQDSGEKSQSSFRVAVNLVDLSDGYVSYRSGETFYDAAVSSAQVSLKDLLGPYELKASLVTMKTPIELNAKIAAIADKIPMQLQLSSDKTQITSDFTWDRVATQFTGKADVDFDPALVLKLKPEVKLPKLLASPAKLQSNFNVTLESAELKNMIAELKGQKLKGNLSAKWKESIAIQGDLQGLPGQSKIAFDAKKEAQRWVGSANANIPALVPLLKWIEIATDSIPPKLTKDIVISTSFDVDGETKVRDLDLTIGQARLKGEVTYQKVKEGHKAVFALSTPNADQILALVPRELDSRVGEASLSGTLAGDDKHLRFSLNPSFASSQIQLEGDAYSLRDKIRFDIGVDLKTSKLSSLMKIAGTSLPGTFEKAKINGRLKGTADAVDVDLKTQLEELDLGLKGAISELKKAPKLDLRIAASDPSFRDLMKRLDYTTKVPDGPLTLAMRLQGSPKNINGTDLKMSVGSKITVAGTFAIDREHDKPFIKANINTGALDLESLYPSSPDSPKSASGSPWSSDPMDFGFLEKMNADVDIRAPSAKRKDIVIQNPRLAVKINSGVLTVAPLSGNIFGGALNASATLSSKNDATLKAELKDANVHNLVPKGSSIKIVDGRLSLNSDFSTQGKSVRDMISMLRGKVNFSSKEGTISGFDLKAISQQISSFKDWTSAFSLLRTSLNGGQTDFKTYGGEVNFERGIGAIRSMTLSTDVAEANAKGVIDLPSFKLDIKAELRLTEHREFPPIGMRLKGPIDSPERELDTGALQNYLVKNVFTNVVQNVLSGRVNDIKRPADVVDKVFGKSPAAPKDQNKKQPEKQAPGFMDLLKKIPRN